ncbi:hypothetical protein Tco_0761186 [Tanacetum coccineum]
MRGHIGNTIELCREQYGTSFDPGHHSVCAKTDSTGLRSEDPNQHLKVILKNYGLYLTLTGENSGRTRMFVYVQFLRRDQASNWRIERLSNKIHLTHGGSHYSFLAQFCSTGEGLAIATFGSKSKEIFLTVKWIDWPQVDKIDSQSAPPKAGLVYDPEEGMVTFEKDNEKITFKMPHKMEAFNHINFKDVNTDSIPPFVLENNDDHGKTYYSDRLTLRPRV